MFNTIRSKISVIALFTLLTLMLVVSCFAYIFLKNSKSLLLQTYSKSIGVIAQDINKEVIKIENNAKDLALIGSLFYSTDKNPQKINYAITRIFNNYPDSLGGGIWFEPYLIDKLSKRYCIYAYKNKSGKIIIDKSFASDEYNYLNQKWYKEIFPLVSKENPVDWSSPYYENLGSNTLMITAGAGIYDKKGNKVGISTVDWEISSIVKRISEIKPTPNSFALFADTDNDYILVSTDKYLDNGKLIGKSLKNIPWYADNLKQITYFTYQNQKFIPYVKTLDNHMILIVCIPKNELFHTVVTHVIALHCVLLLVSIIMAALLYLSLNRNIMRPINKLMQIANKIGKGEIAEIKLEKPEEFAQLADTFDKMTKDIKQITKEREKINLELSVARTIQLTSLPNVFPPFPTKTEFDIFASMEPAKEVGGDFYDFYFIDNNTLMFLIADVSGKGIPAALFMMTAKTLVNNSSQLGYSAEKLIKTINEKICASNNMGLFITMLAGIIDLNTGKITYINCGHNQPLLKRANGAYEYLSLPTNIVLGAFENADFEIYEDTLKKGDTLFLYTDGLTEAYNGSELYGEKRLKECVNTMDNDDLKLMSENIKKEIKEFTGGTEQSDDVTMLVFQYRNENQEEEKRSYKDDAIKENYKPFYQWLHKACNDWNLSDNLTNKIDMCAEEIYANITFYSYPNPPGTIEVDISKDNEFVELVFSDEGVPYNPLEKADPDITLPPEERPLGGLGIFMVKEIADNVDYVYTGNQNILTIKFKI